MTDNSSVKTIFISIDRDFSVFNLNENFHFPRVNIILINLR